MPIRRVLTLLSIVLVLSLALLGVLAPSVLRSAAAAIDDTGSGEPLKDAWGRLRWHEDWRRASPLSPALMDDTWLQVARQAGEIRIAHALGASASPQANTLEAMRVSRRQGFRFFEVDLWLDDSGRLRCFHGDDAGGAAPEPFRLGDCTFEDVAAELGDDTWLILDIKSDFARTGADIVRRLRASGRPGRQFIFQLYHPTDVDTFAGWTTSSRLASPIITTYAAHRSVAHVVAQLARLNVHALAVPIYKLDKVVGMDRSQLLMTHPVHDCAAMTRARAAGARAFYTLSSLPC